MDKSSTLIALSILFIASCVPNKKTVLLQYGNELKQDKYPSDTILRSYNGIPFDYKIQPEDILSITVSSLTRDEYDFFNETNNSNLGNIGQQNGIILSGYLVDYNGEIEFPVVDKLKVAGLTIYEAQELIQSKAQEFLKEPVVSIRLLNFRITVLGEVIQEGTISLFNNRTNIVEVIGLAGGFDNLADRSNIKVLRHENNKVNVYYLDLLSEDLVKSPLYYAHNNDVVIVPPLKQKPFRQDFGQNFALVASTLSLIFLAINLFN